MRRIEQVERGVGSQFLQALNEQGLKLTPDGLYEMAHKPGVASLFDPVNSSPYVVTFGHDDNLAHITTFEPEEGSGTDKMRCRIAAKEFYLQQQPLKERMN